jgi:hypothetical protein
METEHNPDQELQWTDNMRNYTTAMALLKATMYHHTRSIKNGKRRPPLDGKWEQSPKIGQYIPLELWLNDSTVSQPIIREYRPSRCFKMETVQYFVLLFE